MRLILPMAGNGSRFFDDGYDLPKPLIDVGGKPMFMRVIENLGNTIDFSDVTCIVRKDHVEKYAIDDRIQHYDSSFVLDNVLHHLLNKYSNNRWTDRRRSMYGHVSDSS